MGYSDFHFAVKDTGNGLSLAFVVLGAVFSLTLIVIAILYIVPALVLGAMVWFGGRWLVHRLR